MNKKFTFLRKELAVFFLFFVFFWQTMQAQSLQQGVLLFSTKDYEEAHEVFVKYILQNSHLPKQDLKEAEFYRAMCEIVLQRDGVDFLIERFESKFSKDSLSYELRYQLGTWHFTKENWHKAYSHLQKSQGGKKDDLELLYRLAICAQRTNKKLEAQKLLEQVRDRERNLYTFASARMLGELYYEQSQWDSALTNLEFSLKESGSHDPQTHLQIAECYYRLNRLEEFEKYATKYLTSEHLRKGQISMWLGEAYFNRSNFVEASKYLLNYAENVRVVPRDVLYKLGFAFLRADDPEMAVKYLAKVEPRKDFLYQLTTSSLGEAYWAEFKQSFHDKDEIRTEDPEELLALATENLIKAFNMDFVPMAKEKALFYLTETYLIRRQTERVNDLVEEYFLRFGKNGSYASKMTELRRKTIIPTSATLRQRVADLEKFDLKNFKIKNELQINYAILAEQSRKAGNIPQAALDGEKSLNNVTDRVLASETHYWVGEAQTHLAEYEKAITHYSKVSDKNQYYPYVRLGLGRAYFFMRKYDEAIRHLRQYIKLYGEQHAADSSLQTALLYLGNSYAEQKKYTEALEQYEKIDLKKTFWKKDEFRFRKAEVLKVLQHNQEALNLLDSLIMLHPKSEFVPDALLRQGTWNLDMNQPAKALKPLGKLIEKFPKHPKTSDAYFNRSRAHWLVKDTVKSILDAEYLIKNYPTHPLAPQANELLNFARGKIFKKPIFLPSGGTAETIFETKKKVYQGGQCSHYANKFIGVKMSNGQPYQPKAYTAAHLTLPLGTEIEVRNLKNGKTVVVMITDRGPYGKTKRILDLSHIAASEIGLEEGVTDIEIVIVKEVEKK